MMTKEAMELLLNLLSSSNPHAIQLGDNPHAVPFAMVPSGVEVKTMEQFIANPVRFRGTFSTSVIEEFCTYILRTMGDAGIPTVFINPERMEAVAYFDLGTPEYPGWGQNVAKLKLEYTQPFNALVEASKQAYTQKAFSQFLRDWNRSITVNTESLVGTDLISKITIQAAIHAIMSVETKALKSTTATEAAYKAQSNSFEEIEMKAAASNVKLPTGFDFFTATHVGLDERPIECEILPSLTQEDKPIFKFRIVGIDHLMEVVRENFKNRITQELMADNVGIVIYQGIFQKG